jgi:tetratricopeptide (TPR) repeat protein
MKAGNAEPAAQAFMLAHQKGSNELGLYINLGSLFLRGKQIEEAHEWTTRGLHNYPRSGHLHYNMGGVMLARGNHDDAKQYYRKAALLDSNLRPPIPVE